MTKGDIFGREEYVRTPVKYAQKWGIAVELDRKLSCEHTDLTGPSCLSIRGWGSKSPLIYRHRSTPLRWPDLLHEIAHVVCPIKPTVTDELSETIGFEYLSILHLGFVQTSWEGMGPNS